MQRAVLLALVAVLLHGSAAAGDSSRFFFSGDGGLDLHNAHFDEHLSVRYRDAGGQYDALALAQIERLFRSRSDGASAPVSLRLIELIDFVQDRWRPTRLTLVSGYRSPELNQALRAAGNRVAQSSLHTEGLAADLQPAGVDLQRLWRELRGLEVGGVGLYRKEGFLHIDTGRPRFWEPATSGTEKNLSADNARLLARTDFDRYADLDGAVIRLHAVTALPIRIERTARIGDQPLTLVPPVGASRSTATAWSSRSLPIATPSASRHRVRRRRSARRSACTPARRASARRRRRSRPIPSNACRERARAAPVAPASVPVAPASALLRSAGLRAGGPAQQARRARANRSGARSAHRRRAPAALARGRPARRPVLRRSRPGRAARTARAPAPAHRRRALRPRWRAADRHGGRCYDPGADGAAPSWRTTNWRLGSSHDW
jgi:uncharacterized protein YcbK (DUF882 family)